MCRRAPDRAGRSPRRSVRVAACLATVAFATVAAAGFDLVLVTGGSMHPTIERGDLAVVCAWRSPGPGDVVLAARPDGTRFVHRVTSVGPSAVHTQGDANPLPDRAAIPLEQIRGTLVAVIRSGAILGLGGQAEVVGH